MRDSSGHPGAPRRQAVTYLIVGIDQTTLARWHRHVLARDVTTATRIARERAADDGVRLVVAAVIGPNSSVVPDAVAERPAVSRAA
jgi:hypothetical protein